LHSGAEALRAARFRQTDISVMYADGNHALQLRETTQPEADVADEGPDASDLLGEMLSELSGIGAIAMRNDGPFVAGGPILATLAISLTRWDLLTAPKVVGLDNYLFVLSDPDWWRAVWNTLIFTFFSVTLETILGLAVALVANTPFKGRTLTVRSSRAV